VAREPAADIGAAGSSSATKVEYVPELKPPLRPYDPVVLLLPLFIPVVWIVRTGSPWRDLPPFFGNWNTIHCGKCSLMHAPPSISAG